MNITIPDRSSRRILDLAANPGRRSVDFAPPVPAIEPGKAPVPALCLASSGAENADHSALVGFSHFCALMLGLCALVGTFPTTSHAAEPVAPLVAVAESRFDEAVDGQHGWSAITVENWDAPFKGRNTGRSDTGGISGKYLRVGETTGDGRSLFLLAAPIFLGDQRNVYGGRFEYDLRQLATTGLGNGYDVTLFSGNSRLIFHSGRLPDSAWHHFVVPLHESGAWFNADTRERATRDELVAVLSNLTRLAIRAEYSQNGFEETQLDNVVLSALAPIPFAEEVTAVTFAGLTIHGQAGDKYEILSATHLSELAGDWTSIAKVTLDTPTYHWVDPDSVVTSLRFYRTRKLD